MNFYAENSLNEIVSQHHSIISSSLSHELHSPQFLFLLSLLRAFESSHLFMFVVRASLAHCELQESPQITHIHSHLKFFSLK